jgi:hypothetical protein
MPVMVMAPLPVAWMLPPQKTPTSLPPVPAPPAVPRTVMPPLPVLVIELLTMWTPSLPAPVPVELLVPVMLIRPFAAETVAPCSHTP